MAENDVLPYGMPAFHATVPPDDAMMCKSMVKTYHSDMFYMFILTHSLPKGNKLFTKKNCGKLLKTYQPYVITRQRKKKELYHMKISTKGRYALRMLIDLAEHRGDGYIALKDIAERQGISKKYLEQIVPILNRSDLLRTNRGKQGGYQLVKTPDQYTVGDILQLTEGGFAPVACVGNNPQQCLRSAECPTFPVWRGLYKVIYDYLDGITLQDIIDQQKAREIDNYMI